MVSVLFIKENTLTFGNGDEKLVLLVAAVGMSGSGKTTVLELLISSLTREGYRVGAIKHIHRENFTIDREGSNTWRFSKAGSKITVAISPEETTIIKKTKTSLDDLDKIVKQLEDENLDIIFIEGFHSFILKNQGILKIFTAENAQDLDKTLGESVPPILAITGLVAKNKPTSSYIPYIDLPSEAAKLIELVKSHLPKNE
jgi:molybdopterin-guanine dinucleotide biosynthesis protein B